MTTGKVTIQNETGLHARPGNEFVTFIKSLSGCKIEVENEPKRRFENTFSNAFPS